MNYLLILKRKFQMQARKPEEIYEVFYLKE
nr:MAG TPA: hypothetical protein [Crassvirales sp.]